MNALSRLEEIGAVEIEAGGDVAPGDGEVEADEAAEHAAAAQERHRAFERSRTDMIRAYAETRDCRRRFLLAYFGEQLADPCGNCDTCEAGIAAESEPGAEPFAVGTRVAHREWGEGVVQRYDDDAMVVLFDSVGYRTLAVELVVERELLSAV